jgi:hypothetical protein
MHPDDLYQSVGASIDGPMPLVIMTHGWIDASDAMVQVRETILRQAEPTVIAEFDTDQLLDQRARRPTMTVIDGVMDHVTWPRLEIGVGTDRNDNPFMLLHGPEPDFRWRPFAKAVATVAGAVGVTTMYTMGAYPAPMPHTRPTRVSTTATRAEMLAGRDLTTGSIEVPIGIFSAVSEELRKYGTETIGLWAQVPYYVSTSSWPHAAHGLLNHLGQVSGLDFDLRHLETQIPEAVLAVENVIESTPSLARVIEDLERRHDELERLEAEARSMSPLSTGDQLEQQVQQYLRNIEGD